MKWEDYRERVKYRKDLRNINEYVNEIRINTDKVSFIKKSIHEFVSKYGLEGRVNLICEYFLNNYTEDVISNILKQSQFVIHILESKGFNEEEISKFLYNHIMIIFTSPKLFKSKLAIFNHFDLFDAAFFESYTILTHPKEYDMRDIYSCLCDKKYSSLLEFRYFVKELSSYKKQELRKKYPLSNQMLHEFYKSMMDKIEEDYISNVNNKVR